MFPLLSEFIRNVGRSITVIVMDKEGMEQPKTYEVEPTKILALLGTCVLVLFMVIQALLFYTPIRYTLPGFGTRQMKEEARLNQIRMDAMTDSLALQAAYFSRLRDMILGNVDTTAAGSSSHPFTAGFSLLELPLPLSSQNWKDHEQPALSIDRLLRLTPSSQTVPEIGPSYLSALSFPVLPPVSGILTRGFDAKTNHFAIDIAVKKGSVVRSIGDGYVVFTDWVNDGGQVIVLAHAGGFVTVFKHNSSLLKQVGDRVRDREAIALSGNSGEITSGPHAHFELWHDGLAQDPRAYVLGW